MNVECMKREVSAINQSRSYERMPVGSAPHPPKRGRKRGRGGKEEDWSHKRQQHAEDFNLGDLSPITGPCTAS